MAVCVAAEMSRSELDWYWALQNNKNWTKEKIRLSFYYFGTLTNKRTIISQIITLLHVSTLLCHPQAACNQYLAKLHKYYLCSCR